MCGRAGEMLEWRLWRQGWRYLLGVCRAGDGFEAFVPHGFGVVGLVYLGCRVRGFWCNCNYAMALEGAVRVVPNGWYFLSGFVSCRFCVSFVYLLELYRAIRVTVIG